MGRGPQTWRKYTHFFQFLDIIKKEQLGVSSVKVHQTFFRYKESYQ